MKEVTIMNKKTCIGCGVELQDQNMLQEGYTTNLENDFCQRCFRIKNYGEYQVVAKSNEEYIEILKEVGKTKDLVLYIVDLANLPRDINDIKAYLGKNPVVLVLNKRDVLPKSVKEEKILSYLKEQGALYEKMILVSCRNNYHIDELFQLIQKKQKSRNVYVIGHTNSGKSSLINLLMKNYSENSSDLTISPLPSTTLNKISIELNDHVTLIDTPGLVDRGSLTNYIDQATLKKINAKKEIKPRTFQIRKNQCLIVDDLVRIDYVEGEKNSFTFYLSNSLKVKKMNALKQTKLTDLAKQTVEMKYYEDLVINGLGWLKVVSKGTIDVYVNKNVEVFTRKSMI